MTVYIQGFDVATLESTGNLQIQELTFNEKSETSITWADLDSITSNNSSSNSSSSSNDNKSNVGYSLFIDDLNALELLAPSINEARLFISNLLGPVTTSSSAISSLVGFGRYSTITGKEELSLTEYCRYRADVTVEVKPLSTGYSLDTHGLIQISSRHSPLSDSDGSNSNASNHSTGKMHGLWFQTLLFKALETGVRCSIVRQKV